MSESFITKLQEVGFNEREAKVYIAALELGQATVQEISKRAGVKRITTHVIIDKFIQEGLLKEIIVGKRRRVVANPPERFLQKILEKEIFIKRQADEFRGLIPYLSSIYNYASGKPRVKYYEGMEGLKFVYQDTIKKPKINMYSFLSVDDFDKEMLGWIKKEYVPRRIEKQIKAYVVVPNTELGKKYHKEDQKKLRESVLIPKKDFPFKLEVIMYDNKVAIVSNKSKNMFALIIESEEVYNTFRSIFKLAWMAAKSMSGEIKK